MDRFWITLAALSLAVVAVGCAAKVNPKEARAEVTPKEATALAEIKQQGGTVTVADDRRPGASVIGVDLETTEVTDAELDDLGGLTKLRSLNLGGTDVTDAELEHLKGWTKLQRLNLWGTKITDAGLERLEGLSGLQSLNLTDTTVTDTGLEHLKGLAELQRRTSIRRFCSAKCRGRTTA